MRLTTRQLGLVAAALVLSGAMLAVVPLVTGALDPLVGYVCVLAIYWAFFCVPIAVVYGRGSRHVAIGLSAAKPWLVVGALALPLLVYFAANPEGRVEYGSGVLALAVVCASINGPFEELAWRRTFRANSDGRLSYELLGLGLFTLWHVPLYLSKGVYFDHGAVGLIGGALFLGAVWTFMTRAGDSVGWPMVSHALVNLAAFLPFFAANVPAGKAGMIG